MRRSRVVGPGMGWAVVACLCLPLVGWAAPTDDLRDTTDRVIKILADPALRAAEKTKERRAEIRRVVGGRFNFEEMARRSLATHWAERTAVEQKDFVGLFTDLIEYAFIERMERFRGEDVQYTGEAFDGDYATVKTQIITRKDQRFPVDYKFFKRGGRWEVYDVVIDGVSLINEYRIQFNKVIRTKSYGELVRAMKAKRGSLDLEARHDSPR